MMDLISLSDALAKTDPERRHVLLANGFSISCRPKIFKYTELFEQAKFKGLPRARSAFTALGTTDFERMIRALRDFAALAPTYYPKGTAGQTKAVQDADALREALVQTIADNHPARPNLIRPEEYISARAFLSDFKRIYTLNYDLLLYWTLMQQELPHDVPRDDGFRTPEGNVEAEYVTWEPENTHKQTVYYLHGALHLFDAGAELQKYTWSGKRVALIDQIREALNCGKYPVFVSEGTSEEKYTRIRHCDYLAKAYRSFIEIGGSLFVYGHGMGANDEHILNAIEHNKVSALYVSLFGDPSSEANNLIVRRASAIADRRHEKKKLEVRFFDAETAQVWSGPAI